jgi:hypothetical protein
LSHASPALQTEAVAVNEFSSGARKRVTNPTAWPENNMCSISFFAFGHKEMAEK